MLTETAFPMIRLVAWGAFFIFLAVMILRLVFNYSDPNPFGTIGRFSFKLRKATERFVYPASRFLAGFKIDTRLSPLLVMFLGFVATYIGMRIIWNAFFVVDGISTAITAGNVKATIGYILYGLLSLVILAIIIRFVGQWFVYARNSFLAAVYKLTDPIILPVQKLIPRVGMFDFSVLVVLILIFILQAVVMNVFVGHTPF
jgi:YggT family protein